MKTATATGKSLITIALSLMLLLSLFAGSASAENMPRSISSDLPEYKTVHVSTADEFLAAIGNNTQIVIDADLIDFSTASDYGKTSGSFYGWIYYDVAMALMSAGLIHVAPAATVALNAAAFGIAILQFGLYAKILLSPASRPAT